MGKLLGVFVKSEVGDYGMAHVVRFFAWEGICQGNWYAPTRDEMIHGYPYMYPSRQVTFACIINNSIY